MKNTALKFIAHASLLVLPVLVALPLPSLAQLPKRDLLIELRQVDEGAGVGYAVSTDAANPVFAEQHVQVRNGEKASLSMGKSMPMQWVQSVSAQSASLAASGASASSAGAGVTQGITWMDSGQHIKVHPSWPGGRQSVTVNVEVQSANVSARVGEELPAQTRSEIATTVSAPLGQWVTIVASGHSPQQGVYGSEVGNSTRRLLQLRVQAP